MTIDEAKAGADRYIRKAHSDDPLIHVLQALLTDHARLRDWVNDLQSGMYINCVYCGHRYGPKSEVPASMSDVLKDHIEQCPRHPLNHAKQEIARLRRFAEGIESADGRSLYKILLARDRVLQGKEPWDE